MPTPLSPEIVRNLWRLTPANMAAHLTHTEPMPWYAAPHLRILSAWICNAVAGRKPRIIVNMPPRHGKSELISKWTPVWYLDNWPHKSIINCGYGTSFAEEWGRRVRNMAVQYQEALRFKLAPDSKAAGRWNTTAGGGMVATGIGGPITGRGADLLLIDDPHKNAQEANSMVFREALWQWYQETARSRVMPGGAIILLMTRWHEDDLAGRLIKASENGTGEHWDVLNMPALADDSPDTPADPLGRLPGEPLWPQLRPLEYLQALMLGMSDEAWQAQYQGQPGNVAKKGNVYKSFSEVRNVRPLAYDPRRPLVWSMDFNVDPMCSVVCQWHEEITPYTYLTNVKKQTIHVLQEICLKDSSTVEACEEFCNRTEAYRSTSRGRQIRVKIYGDRSGQSRKTAGDTDYHVIRDYFQTRPEYSITLHLSKSNPAVKDRVNAVNTKLCNAMGELSTIIDPGCKELIKDFKLVQWKRDSSGNTTGQIDKSDQSRTHASDAYGYFVEKEFGLKAESGEMPGIMQ